MFQKIRVIIIIISIIFKVKVITLNYFFTSCFISKSKRSNFLIISIILLQLVEEILIKEKVIDLLTYVIDSATTYYFNNSN